MQAIGQNRQFLRQTNGDTLFPPGFSRYQGAGRLADPKLSGYKRYQMLIGFAVDRRRLDSKLQPLAMQAGPFILAGFGLNMEIQYQNPMLPMIPIQPITGLTNQVG